MNKLIVAAGLALASVIPLPASAHTDVSVGIGLGVPLYGPPPVYYEPDVVEYEYYAPRRVYHRYYGYYGPRVIYRDYDDRRYWRHGHRWHHDDDDDD